MAQDEHYAKRKELEQAISSLVSQRSILGDSVVDLAIKSLREQLIELVPADEPIRQRKQATVLFMDTVSSTQITRSVEPEENLEIMGGTLDRLTIPIERHGGVVLETMGDGFLAVFGIPTSRENDPVMAVHAALGVIREAEEYGRELERKRGLTGFQVRIGINTGLVAISGEEERHRISGETVVLAARLESAAAPGSILISHNTYQHVRGVFDLRPMEPIQAKGFPQPVLVYQVVRAKARSFRTRRHGVEGIETQMVGRAMELKVLQDAFYTAVEERELQFRTILAEAGMGKSRLLYEFENWVDLQQEDIFLLRGRARLETRGLPYALFRDMFASRFGIQDDDPVQIVRQKIIEGFNEYLLTSTEGQESALYAGQLLGYNFRSGRQVQSILDDAQRLHTRAMRCFVDYFKAVSSQMSILVLLEDLHWADESSLDVLTYLAKDLRGERILIVGAARPELYQSRPHWFEGQNYYQRLNLRALSKRDSRQLINDVLQKVDHVPSELLELVVENAEGNPFYVEELIKMLIEDEVIVTGDERWRVLPDRLADARVPSTLTGVLQARLDSLTEVEVAILQQAAVIGRVFWNKAIEFLNDRSMEQTSSSQTSIMNTHHSDLAQIEFDLSLETMLRSLRARELIYRRDISTFSDSDEHIFKHALLREVTYEGVLKRVRQAYHALAAEWLIHQGVERTGEIAGLIAEHLDLAGKHDDAREHYHQAAKEARERFAQKEALDYLTRALDLTPDSQLEDRFELLMLRESCLRSMGASGQLKRNLDELQMLANALDDDRRRASVMACLGEHLEIISSFKEAVKVTRQELALRQKLGHREGEAFALAQLGWRLHLLGENANQVLSYLEESLAIARDIGDRGREMMALLMLGVLQASQHDLALSSEYYEQSLAIAEEINNYPFISWSLMSLAQNACNMGDLISAKAKSRRALAVARKEGRLQTQAQSLHWLGMVELMMGEYDTAAISLEQGLSLAREVGDSRFEYKILALQGAAQLIQGNVVGAWSHYWQCLEICQEKNFVIEGVISYLDLARTSLIRNDFTAAQQYIQLAQSRFGDRSNPWIESGIQNLLGHTMIGLGNPQEAEKAFQEALEIRHDWGRSYLVIDPMAGLAQIALVQGDLTRASGYVEDILDNRDTVLKTEIFDDLITNRIDLTCYEILEANNDPRARDLLNTIHDKLVNQAAKLPLENREGFIENIPWHQQVIELWNTKQDR
jgi:class 3 adenylate cyclase/tetratricopeptide (TPR) repeat protein